MLQVSEGQSNKVKICTDHQKKEKRIFLILYPCDIENVQQVHMIPAGWKQFTQDEMEKNEK